MLSFSPFQTRKIRELHAKEEGIIMSKNPQLENLTRRERQIMEIVYRLERANAVDVMNVLPDSPSNATVRTMLGVLEDKGYLKHDTEKGKYIYYPTIPLKKARKKMLSNLLDTFYRGAEANAVISILRESEATISDEEADMILELIEKSKKEGR
jgi:BlaI family penicillinase repressor